MGLVSLKAVLCQYNIPTRVKLEQPLDSMRRRGVVLWQAAPSEFGPIFLSMSASDVKGLQSRNYVDPKSYLFDRSGIVSSSPPLLGSSGHPHRK